MELQAKTLVAETARRLEELLQVALSEKKYRELGAISPIAHAVSSIVDSFHSGGNQSLDPAKTAEIRSSTGAGAVEQVPMSPLADRSRVRAKTDVEFPQFRLDGDKLVKIGWSKKDRRTYEHRAPRDGVFQLAATLEERVRPGTPFKMEHFVPLRVGKQELPAYQTYLALAWFRALGIVEESGKLGYRFEEGALSKKKIHNYWTNLPKAAD